VSRRFAVFVNPEASGGRALKALADVRAEFDALGAEYSVTDPASRDACRRDVAAAAAAGDVVVACGGDGMVGSLAGVLRGTETPLAIVPAGRGNDFARVLGIPFDTRAAVRVAVNGVERAVDVAEANGEPYVGIASLGFDSDANRIANEAKLVKGNLVYLYAALVALVRWKHARFTVGVDGDEESFTGWSVAVANNKAYGGGMFVAPGAQLDDGLLDVMQVSESSKLTFLRDLPKVFRGAHGANPRVRFRKGERITVAADRPFTVYADGDPIADLPLTVAVQREALRVIVPAAG